MRCAMGIASAVVLKQSSFRRHLGAVCQWGRLSCKDPAGTTRCVVFTGRLRTFKKNTKMQGLSRLGVPFKKFGNYAFSLNQPGQVALQTSQSHTQASLSLPGLATIPPAPSRTTLGSCEPPESSTRPCGGSPFMPWIAIGIYRGTIIPRFHWWCRI